MSHKITIPLLCMGLLSGCETAGVIVNQLGPTGTPMQQVTNLQPDILNHIGNYTIRQQLNNLESPSVSEISVTNTGIMDTSIAAKRIDYTFVRTATRWELQTRVESYQCRRGPNTTNFQIDLCP